MDITLDTDAKEAMEHALRNMKGLHKETCFRAAYEYAEYKSGLYKYRLAVFANEVSEYRNQLARCKKSRNEAKATIAALAESLMECRKEKIQAASPSPPEPAVPPQPYDPFLPDASQPEAPPQPYNPFLPDTPDSAPQDLSPSDAYDQLLEEKQALREEDELRAEIIDREIEQQEEAFQRDEKIHEKAEAMNSAEIKASEERSKSYGKELAAKKAINSLQEKYEKLRTQKQALIACQGSSGSAQSSGDEAGEPNTPPGAAKGGIIPAQPPYGGLYRIGEEQDEVVIPLDQLRMNRYGGSGVVNYVEIKVKGNVVAERGLEDLAHVVESILEDEKNMNYDSA